MNKKISAISGFILFVIWVGAAPPAAAAELSFPAQALGESLRALGNQTRTNLLFDPEAVKDLKAPAVSRAAGVAQALSQLLAGSGLTYRFVDARTVTLVPVDAKKAPEQSSGAAARVEDLRMARVEVGEQAGAAGQASAAQKEEEETEEESAPQSQVLVTGSRIRGLTGRQSTQPILTITREDINRYGVASIGEIFNYIPQVTGYETGQVVQTTTNLGLRNLDVAANRITATLRGAPAGGTLILINGRRAPKTGLAGAGNGNDGYDLSGIPLAAVERIDVLLDGASAVYGADAVGGVINVILRKDYRGTEAEARYENTHDGKSSVENLALTHGFARGGLSGTASASWERAGTMAWTDRRFLRTFDRRSLGGTDWRPGYFGGTGYIYGYFGDLPGLGTDFALIPVGANGTNMTIADYATGATGEFPPVYDPGDFADYSTPYERTSATGNVDYAFSPALTAFVQARWGESRTSRLGSPTILPDVELPEDYPGNPFGEPIYASKIFYDLRGQAQSVTVNRGLTAGVRGRLAGDWRFETAAHQTSSRSDMQQSEAFFNDNAFYGAIYGPNPPVLLYDSSSGISPNAPGTLEALLAPGFRKAERTRTRIFDFQADGPGLTLPTGEMSLSAGLEYRDENAAFPVSEPNLSIQAHNRYTSGYFAELRVPLVADGRGLPLLHQLEANVAVRHDRYSDFPSATNPRFGLLYRPVQWLALRASRGKGYKVPTLDQLYRPRFQFLSDVAPGFIFDPLRGNEPVVGRITLISAGNPDLTPEHSRTTTAGVVLDAPFISGLSLSLDYYSMEYLNRVGGVSPSRRFILFPDMIIRGARLPGDPPDWPGRTTGFIDIPQNVSLERLSGYDIGVNYQLTTRRGEVTGRVTASRTQRHEFSLTPDDPVSVFPSSPLQVSGSLFWTRGALGAGTVFVHAAEEDEFLPSRTRWDVQCSYDFSEHAAAGSYGASWWRQALSGTRIDLTIFNVFNDEPPLYAGNNFRQPDNSVLDSRMLRYALKATARF